MTRIPRAPDANEDGDFLSPPDPADPVARLIYLIEWSRLRGVRIGPIIEIGDLKLQIQDLRQHEGRSSPTAAADRGPWAEAGYEE